PDALLGGLFGSSLRPWSLPGRALSRGAQGGAKRALNFLSALPAAGLQAIALHTRAQLRAGEPPKVGRLRLVVVRLLEGLEDKLFLQLLYIDPRGREPGSLAAHRAVPGLLLQREREIVHGHNLTLTEDDRPLDDILQLAHIAWPRVAREQLRCRAGQPNALLP